MCHKTCRRHRSRISSAGVKLSFPRSLLLPALECARCNKLPWSAEARKPGVRRHVVCGTCVPESRSMLLLWSANTQAEYLQKGNPSLGPGKRWVGGVRSTVAHKRISPPHKDSGPLLSLTRSTKEMTFVCLSGRRGCVRTVQPGARRRRRWHWWWGYNDRRGGWGENTRLPPFICSGLLFHRAPLALSNGLL